MTLRTLPAARTDAKPGVRTELSRTALSRWNAGLQAAAAEEQGDATITVLDVIGEGWFEEGVTSRRIAAALRSIGERDVTVVMNSPGGDYFEGLAIYNLLREHKGRVTVKIVGIAASAASVIAMAADEVRIARAGFLMIHNCWVVSMGDKAALREVADWLEPFDATAIDIYAARTGLEAAELAKMLDRETWIGGAAAVDQGFADDFLGSDELGLDAQAAAEGRPRAAAHKVDLLLARAGVSRSERRDLVAQLKGGTRDAAPTGTRDAAVIAGVEGLLRTVQSI